MPMLSPPPHARRQRGATLIESLVSLIILAIAIIGMLGVQARTLMETNTAAFRTQAMLLVDDLSARIKANPGGYAALDNYVFDYTRTVGSTNCEGAACNADDLAAYDLDRWQENLQASMPGARVETFISSDNDATTGNRQLGVLIGWTLREKNTDNASDYLKNLIVPADTMNAGVSCWTGYICHLVYLEP